MSGNDLKAREHPGPYIYYYAIPSELNVTTAAKVLGVSRPSLSNLVNGKAALSPEMALRLKIAFNADIDDLLTKQALFDAYMIQRTTKAKELNVRPYKLQKGKNRKTVARTSL